MNTEDRNQSVSPVSTLLSGAETLRNVGSVLEILAGKQGTGGIKIPNDLFEDLPEAEPDDGQTAVEETAAASATPQEPTISSELLLRLPEIVSAAAPVLSLLGSHSRDASGRRHLSKLLGTPGDVSRRVSLLLALKPYLNEHKCKTVDMLVGVSKLSGIIQKG